MYVITKHSPNRDIRGGYWNKPPTNGRALPVHVADVNEAADVCRAYIERNGLGGGNWTGGDVYDGETAVAYVSYNGRVWPPRENNVLRLMCAPLGSVTP